MRFVKTRLAVAEQGYSITSMPILGRQRIVAAAEGHGPVMTFDLPSLEPSILAVGPGGFMGLVAYPGRDDALLAITRFYPIFQSEAAGIDVIRAVDGLAVPWQSRRLVDLPFVYRISVVGNGQDDFLVAASLCGGKGSRDDWSRPGSVYVATVPSDPDGPWEPVSVLDGLHRNHGMFVGDYRGRRSVYIAGDEGLFALEVPEAGASEWQAHQLIERPISELWPLDIDGDGVDEIAVIEPFHGPAMTIYKEVDGAWHTVYTGDLAFGHGLWAGSLGGSPAVIAGNRDGDRDLVCWRVTSTQPLTLEQDTIDAGSETANVAVIDFGSGKAVISSNIGHGEYALYEVRPE